MRFVWSQNCLFHISVDEKISSFSSTLLWCGNLPLLDLQQQWRKRTQGLARIPGLVNPLPQLQTNHREQVLKIHVEFFHKTEIILAEKSRLYLTFVNLCILFVKLPIMKKFIRVPITAYKRIVPRLSKKTRSFKLYAESNTILQNSI